MSWKVKTFVHNPFGENTYLVYGEGEECIFIDCGALYREEENEIRQFVSSHHLKPIAHLLTHGHLDHCFGAAFLFEEYGLQPMVAEPDIPLYAALLEQCRMFGIPTSFLHAQFPDAQPLTDVALQLFGITVLPSPGHTPGGVCYWLNEASVLFTGDTIFAGGGQGRTDLPGGDDERMQESLWQIRQFIRSQAQITCYPGHGPCF